MLERRAVFAGNCAVDGMRVCVCTAVVVGVVRDVVFDPLGQAGEKGPEADKASG